MARYQFTNKAVQDLKEIWNYTFENWSEKQADKHFKDIIKSCTEIANVPLMNKEYDNLVIGLRGVKVNKHIIFYRQLTEDEIEIERILHERMDLKTRFGN